MEKFPNSTQAIPEAEMADMRTSPVTAEEMKAAVEALGEQSDSGVEQVASPETQQEVHPESEKQAEFEAEKKRNEIRAQELKSVRESLANNPEIPVSNKGPEGGGGRIMHTYEKSSKFKMCEACGGKGRRYIFLSCRVCSGSGRVVDSAVEKKATSVS